eukprot:1162128-Pelagomonas_calceolata.AAC.15
MPSTSDRQVLLPLLQGGAGGRLGQRGVRGGGGVGRGAGVYARPDRAPPRRVLASSCCHSCHVAAVPAVLQDPASVPATLQGSAFIPAALHTPTSVNSFKSQRLLATPVSPLSRLMAIHSPSSTPVCCASIPTSSHPRRACPAAAVDATLQRRASGNPVKGAAGPPRAIFVCCVSIPDSAHP